MLTGLGIRCWSAGKEVYGPGDVVGNKVARVLPQAYNANPWLHGRGTANPHNDRATCSIEADAVH